MAQLDAIKEEISTLRNYLNISVALLAAVTGGLIVSYRSNILDGLFWLGLDLNIALLSSIILIGREIRLLTEKLRSLS